MKLRNSFDLRKQARPFLEGLAAEAGESCQIQVPAGDRMLQLDFVPPPADYYLAVTPGIRLYRHGNAFGKAVLAFLPPGGTGNAVRRSPAPAHPAHDRRSGAAPRRVRGDPPDPVGFGIQRIRARQLLHRVAGLQRRRRPVAGIGITGLSSRLHEERLPELRKLVLACAEHISESIGYKEA